MQAQMMQVNLEKTEDFKNRIALKLRVLQAGMLEIQGEIAANLGSPENLQGFLIGAEQDYFDDFNDQVLRFNGQIEKVTNHWSDMKLKLEEIAANSVETDKFSIINEEIYSSVPQKNNQDKVSEPLFDFDACQV